MEMSRTIIILISAVLLFISSCTQTMAAPPPPAVQRAYTDYIKIKCNIATYPPLCTKHLYPYAAYVRKSPIRLCNAALLAAIQGARNASTTIMKIAQQKGISRYEAAALRDCIDDVRDTVSQLKDTLNAMAHLADPDREFQWSNAKTRASAAITDAESCKDGFSGKRVNPVLKTKISTSVAAVEKLVSNALSLINDLY